MEVAVACGKGPGIIVAVNAREVGDACGRTIVAVGENIELGQCAGGEDKNNEKVRRPLHIKFHVIANDVLHGSNLITAGDCFGKVLSQ
jgi:hypothetical protein